MLDSLIPAMQALGRWKLRPFTHGTNPDAMSFRKLAPILAIELRQLIDQGTVVPVDDREYVWTPPPNPSLIVRQQSPPHTGYYLGEDNGVHYGPSLDIYRQMIEDLPYILAQLPVDTDSLLPSPPR